MVSEGLGSHRRGGEIVCDLCGAHATIDPKALYGEVRAELVILDHQLRGPDAEHCAGIGDACPMCGEVREAGAPMHKKWCGQACKQEAYRKRKA